MGNCGSAQLYGGRVTEITKEEFRESFKKCGYGVQWDSTFMDVYGRKFWKSDRVCGFYDRGLFGTTYYELAIPREGVIKLKYVPPCCIRLGQGSCCSHCKHLLYFMEIKNWPRYFYLSLKT